MSKDDIAVTPFTGTVGDMRPTNSNVNKPIFLVSLEEGTKNKGISYYLCLKLDKHDSYIEFKGQRFDGSLDELSDPHAVFDLTKTQEICVPWHRVVQVKNLSFKPTK